MIAPVFEFLYAVNCDYCPDGDEFEAEGWKDLISNLKDLGWKIKNIRGVWKHMCPACASKIEERLNK